MAVKHTDLPGILLDRVQAAHPAPALFSAVEAEDWPEGALHHLIDSGILKATSRASALACDGCEMGCHKPVVVRRIAATASSVAFINCDEAPGYGRIPVSMDQLKRFSASRSSIAGFVSAALGFAPANWPFSSDLISIGAVKGRYGPRRVQLTAVDRQLILMVGRQQAPLHRVLLWTVGGISVDMNLLGRLSNRKEPLAASAGEHLSPSNAGNERSRSIRDRNARILREANKLRDGQGLSWSMIAEQITQMPFMKSPADKSKQIDAGTVRRILSSMMKR